MGKLSLNTLIAGGKSVSDWFEIREKLDRESDYLWQDIYKDFFHARLNDRYLVPINNIKANGRYKGEGFAIMTILCSLIEFLESTHQGVNYRFRRSHEPPLTEFEYSKSESLFIDFLTKRIPFSSFFDEDLAHEFYKNVRCGLLHEARTKGKWTIKGGNIESNLIDSKEDQIILNRNVFYNSIIEYVEVRFKRELFDSIEMKAAFIRKFDNLCYE